MTNLNNIQYSWHMVMDAIKSQNEFINEIQGSRWGAYSLHTSSDGKVKTIDPEKIFNIDNQIYELADELNKVIQAQEPDKTIRDKDFLFRLFDIKELLKEEKSQLVSPRYFDTQDDQLKAMIEKTEILIDEFEDIVIANDTNIVMSH